MTLRKLHSKSYLKAHPPQPESYIHRSAYPRSIVEDDRTGMSVETLTKALRDNLYYIQGREESSASRHDYYMALAYTMRDRLIHRWINTQKSHARADAKKVFYLSAEFLMGPQLANNLLHAGCYQNARTALQRLGLNLYDLLEQESEPGLGNGGLGRLAACFLDSLAALDIPACGYGIRYEFGIFAQQIEHGWQVEHPDKWLLLGSPWEIHRPEDTVEVKFGGHTESYRDARGKYRVRWIPQFTILGTPYDALVPGYNTDTVNTLRLWSAGASEDFDFQIFDAGDYTRAVEKKTFSENISKVLYPNDNTAQGKELRLQQQYFFVSCSLQDILRMHVQSGKNLECLPEKIAVQLNDTHPAVAVAELMRLLVDEHQMGWDQAWRITQQSLAYTNHTLLAEAMECWPVDLFGRLLPRHLEIIYEINHRFTGMVRAAFPGDKERVRRMSIIQEGPVQQIRMAHLATVGSHAVNGVAELHSQLLKREVLRDFYELWPEKFGNKTNGVSPRRWLMLCNPKLTYLITEKLGTDWIRDLKKLEDLAPFAENTQFRETWQAFKYQNKEDLAEYVLRKCGVVIDPNSLYDIQVKRIHEYKRQLLNVLHIITLYHRIKADSDFQVLPRTFIFGGKAAPGYLMAKMIIKLINSVGEVINADPDVKDRIKVVFLPNYSVHLGERVYPAADLSEQISTAGKEASGTGNMKFCLNGAVTIGTLDGANIEIREEVGVENFFLFGLNMEDIRTLRAEGYDPRSYYARDHELARVIDGIASGEFSRNQPSLFQPIVDSLLNSDTYFLLADYRSYVDCQDRVSQTYSSPDQWTRMSILNAAGMGKFSSDRTIQEYCQDIWKVTPVPVEIEEAKQKAIHKFRERRNQG